MDGGRERKRERERERERAVKFVLEISEGGLTNA